jgi:predicted DNA-binding transcriptional regulator YafY
MRQAICSAIDAHQLLAFGYEGTERIVEPHLCGNNTAGHDALLAWFVRGHSDSGARPGWRTYLLTEMRDVRALEETFPSARAGYNPTDGSMRLVYCRLPPDSG